MTQTAHLEDQSLRAVLAQVLLAAVGDAATPLHIAGGSYVFRAGDTPKEVFVLCDGRVSLSPPGDRGQLLQVLEAPDVFGDGALFSRAEFAVDARAMVDSVVMSVPAAVFFDCLTRHPTLTRNLVQALARRVLELQSRMGEMLAGDVRRRLIRFLLDSAGDRVELSQGAIAELLGAHRTTVHRVLHDLHELGAITIAYRQVDIVDRAVLGREAAARARSPYPTGGWAA
jgi:CRP/FNR family cyclic AMP-dependent transcriptional regulator